MYNVLEIEGVPFKDEKVPQGEEVPKTNQQNRVLVVPVDMNNVEIRWDLLTLD